MTKQDELREAAWQKYLACCHDPSSHVYSGPMSVCDVCRGRHSAQSFNAGYASRSSADGWVAVSDDNLPDEYEHDPAEYWLTVLDAREHLVAPHNFVVCKATMGSAGWRNGIYPIEGDGVKVLAYRRCEPAPTAYTPPRSEGEENKNDN